MLAICAAVQVLGHWYETSAGERVDGVGLLDATTSPQDARTIGELVTKPLLAGLTATAHRLRKPPGRHGARAPRRPRWARWSGARATGAGDGIRRRGSGQRGRDLHARPCLARNPELADLLLSKVVGELAPLELPEVELLRRERLTG